MRETFDWLTVVYRAMDGANADEPDALTLGMFLADARCEIVREVLSRCIDGSAGLVLGEDNRWRWHGLPEGLRKVLPRGALEAVYLTNHKGWIITRNAWVCLMGVMFTHLELPYRGRIRRGEEA